MEGVVIPTEGEISLVKELVVETEGEVLILEELIVASVAQVSVVEGLLVGTEGELSVIRKLVVVTKVAISGKLVVDVDDGEVSVVVVLLLTGVVVVVEWWKIVLKLGFTSIGNNSSVEVVLLSMLLELLVEVNKFRKLLN